MTREVLIVEDDPSTRELWVDLLSQAGFASRAAHNGNQALDACRQHRPDLVVTDLRVPGLDGFELARELHAQFGERTPPIIAVTGFVPEDDDPRLARARFHRLLVKPVAPALFLDAVGDALDGSATLPPAPTR